MNEIDVVKRLYVPDEPSERTRADAAARLQRRIDGVHGSRSPQRRPRALLGAAAGLALTGLIAVALAGGGSESRLVAPASAAQALSRVAGVAAQRDDPALRPGEFWYVQDRSRYLTTFDERLPFSVLGATELRETWTDRGADGRYESTLSGQPEFPGPRDERRSKLAGRPQAKVAGYQGASAASPPSAEPGNVVRASPEPADTTSTARAATTEMGFRSPGFGAGARSLSYEQLADLPTEGRAMYDRLRKLAGGAGRSPDQEVFTIIGDLLRSDPVPPKVRAGLYRAAVHIKGIRLVGAVTDSLGRHGVAVELATGGTRSRLVFDPDTALLLAEQDVLARRVPYVDAEPGAVIGERIAVRQAIVATAHSRPR